MNSLSTKTHLCKPLQVPGCDALIGEASTEEFENVGEDTPHQLQTSKGWKVELIYNIMYIYGLQINEITQILS